MAAPVITISNPKRLIEGDFQALRGTVLYEQMFRNRCRVEVKGGLNDARAVAWNDITEWLKANCGTFYHVDESGGGWVYIEGDSDAVNFKMRFHDQEVAIPEPPPPPKPKPTAARPSQPQSSQPQSYKHTHKDWMKIFEGANKSRGYFGDDIQDFADEHGISEDTVRQVLSYLNDK